MKKFIIATLIFTLFYACSSTQLEQSKTITDTEDYKEILKQYQDQSHKEIALARTAAQANFWNKKIKEQPNGYTYYDKLAVIRDEQFELTGEVKNLQAVDTLYSKATDLTAGNRKSNYLLKRSANAVKLHQFNQALAYAQEAYPLANEKYGSILMMYDAYMELGMYDQADHIMRTQRNYDSFDYLVRYSKYLDHTGDLDSAIVIMENANQIVIGKHEDNYQWSLASLGDMYGHQGDIQRSYNTYLKVLESDPDNHHVLKGIGYIAYAHDNKLQEAKQIFRAIDDQTKLPDHKLMLADIAILEESKAEYDELIKDFRSVAEEDAYQDMYKKYLLEIYLEDEEKKDSLVSIAEREIEQRATPMTYQLLARAKLANGAVDEAAQLINDHVLGKSFEPELVYNSGIILLEHGDVKNARKLLQEAKEASFELGPLVSKNIEERLNSI